MYQDKRMLHQFYFLRSSVATVVEVFLKSHYAFYLTLHAPISK